MTRRVSGRTLALLGYILALPAALFWLIVVVALLLTFGFDVFLGLGFEAPYPEITGIIVLLVLPAVAFLLGLAALSKGGARLPAIGLLAMSSFLLLLILAGSFLRSS